MKEEIVKEIVEKTNANYVKVIDTSHEHVGHRGASKDGNTHFKVVVCSDVFNDMSRVSRHKTVNDICKSFFDRGLHALSIETLTTLEWENKYG